MLPCAKFRSPWTVRPAGLCPGETVAPCCTSTPAEPAPTCRVPEPDRVAPLPTTSPELSDTVPPASVVGPLRLAAALLVRVKVWAPTLSAPVKVTLGAASVVGPPKVRSPSERAEASVSARDPVLLRETRPWKLFPGSLNVMAAPVKEAGPVTLKEPLSVRLPLLLTVSLAGDEVMASVRLLEAARLTSPPGSLMVTVPVKVLPLCSRAMGARAVRLVVPAMLQTPT